MYGGSMLTGCGNSAPEEADTAEMTGAAEEADATKKADTEETTESAAAGEINLMASQNWIKDVDNELFDKFEEETGIKVKVSLTPDNEYETLLGTTLSGGSDVVDMFMYGAGSQMISAGIPDVAVDLSGEEWVNNLETWAVNANTYDGQAEDWFGSYISLQDRETVMMFTYSAYAAELKANGCTDEFGMFPLPVLDNKTAVSNGGGYSKFINKNSKNIEACKALLNFLAEDENLETYYAARTDLVTASFKDVESVAATTATTDVLSRTEEPVVMLIKDVLYWDPDVYKYLQGMADGTTSSDDFISNVDEYRETMFDTVAE